VVRAGVEVLAHSADGRLQSERAEPHADPTDAISQCLSSILAGSGHNDCLARGG
jgi:hypothetical protein